MKAPETQDTRRDAPARQLLVWDLPTRLFHWLLVILVSTSFVTAGFGVNAMQYHQWCGLAILTLLLFRLAWGVVGSRESRFTTFVKGPTAVVRYAAHLMRPGAPQYPGHNPLGGWSIMAMLLSLIIQVGTGLFANDDIFTEGPLYAWVSKETSDWLTRVHKLNQDVLILLVSVHVLAVLFYLFFKRENLITPMITGVKRWPGTDAGDGDARSRTWVAALITALAACAVYLLVR